MRTYPTSQKKTRPTISYFMMLELTASVVILVILTTSFFLVVNNMNKATTKIVTESRAILVLDNTLERISQISDRNPEKIKRIFNDEFKKSSIGNIKSVTNICEIRKTCVRKKNLTISIKRNSKTLAEININL